MARPPRIDANEDGSVGLRTEIGPSTWALIQTHAKRLGVTDAQAVKMLLLYLETLIRKGHIAWLALDWQQSAEEQREAHGGLPPSLAGVDPVRLHRSARSKSGFAGVYVNGEGFRAAGRRGETIGTFSTAEEAAARRYLYYKQHGLPYGELELEIDRLRRAGEAGDDAALRRVAIETARISGTLHHFEAELEPHERGGGPSAEIQPMGFGPGGLEAASAALQAHDATDPAGRSLVGPRRTR